MFDKSWQVFALLLAAAAPAALAGGAASFALVPEAKVDSSGIFLSQIVRPPPSATIPLLRLAPAPPLGQTTPLSRQQIIDLAKATAPELDSTNWTGPNAVRVSRRTRELDQAEVTDMLRAVLQRDYVGSRGELELRLTQPWTPVTVPDEPLSLRVTDLPLAGIMPSEVAGFELWCGKERIGAWQQATAARVWHEVPVAHSQLQRGQLLRDADIVLERRDVLGQHEACIRFPVTDEYLELNASVSVGSPVWARCAHPRPVVRRGHLVEAVFQEGDLMISLKVETLEDGALGQTVRVRNPKTRRELFGKVQNEDLILITL
ncbi:MAG: flagellar basal body P-ring formation chaperone FlgA [Limisphaerales bacterium]